MVPVYVVHMFTPGRQRAVFQRLGLWCWTGGQWLSDTTVFPSTLGDSQHGVTVDYGACKFSPIHVLTINYFENGTTPTTHCCFYNVFGDPRLRPNCPIQVVDCDGATIQATGGAAILNPNPACNCTYDDRWAAAPSLTCPVADEATTWGRLKATYVE